MRTCFVVLAVVVGVLLASAVEAAPPCARGFTHSRRFAGCVQENCGSVPEAHYAAGGECVCSTSGSIANKPGDPTQECTRPKTDEDCPGCVFKCVREDQTCPDFRPEPPTQGPKPRPSAKPPTPSTPTLSCPEHAKPDGDNERCWCDAGFEPTPVNGRCLEAKAVSCGDGVCGTDGGDGRPENCLTCPVDCGCDEGMMCLQPAETDYGQCVPQVAAIFEIGCTKGSKPPRVMVKRPLGHHEEARLDTPLSEGDTVTIESYGDRECKGPYVTFRWGGNLGRVVLDGDIMHVVKIRNTAIESGWPRRKTAGKHGADDDIVAVWTFLNQMLHGEIAGRAGSHAVPLVARKLPSPARLPSRLIPALNKAGRLAASTPGFIFELLSPSNKTAYTTRIWINSHIVVTQRANGAMEVFTLEGHPDLSINDGPKTTLEESLSLAIDAQGRRGEIRPFDPADLDAVVDPATPWCSHGQLLDETACMDPAELAALASGASRLEDVIAAAGIGLLALSALGLAASLARR